MNNVIRSRTLIVVGGVLAFWIIAWILLALVYAIPSSAMDKNTNESLEILRKESLYPQQYASSNSWLTYDNSTTFVMLNLAVHVEDNPFIAALDSVYYRDPTDFPSALEKGISGEANASYVQYWHGYLVYLKPLLVLFNVREIRLLLQTVFFIFLILVTSRLAMRNSRGRVTAILLALSFLLFGCAQASATLPIFPSFLLSMIGCLWMLRVLDKPVGWSRVFSSGFTVFCSFGVIGALIAFFDFLDNPILTLCIPLALYIFFKKDVTIRGAAIIIVLACCGWALGYASMELGKLVLTEAVVGLPAIEGALDQFIFRSGLSDEDSAPITRMDAVSRNFSALGFMKYVFAIVCGGALVSLIVHLVFALKDPKAWGSRLAIAGGLILVSLMPYIWYMVMANHSYVHSFFIAYRTQLGAFFPWLLMIACLFYMFVKSRKSKDQAR